MYSICSRQCILFVAVSKKTQLSLHSPRAALIHRQTPPFSLPRTISSRGDGDDGDDDDDGDGDDDDDDDHDDGGDGR